MNTIHLNIGLSIGTKQDALQMPQIAVALEQALAGMEIRESYIRQSSTERTACIIIRGEALNERELNANIMHLCDLLSQEAIAGKWFASNPLDCDMQFLIGPKAEAWGGAFNPDYWLDPVPDNAPVAADDALWTLRHAVMQRTGWTIAAHEARLTGWFERDSDGTGGDLWYSRENPETGIKDGHLHLIDYDGVFALPRPVLIALRLAGVSVDSTFE